MCILSVLFIFWSSCSLFALFPLLCLPCLLSWRLLGPSSEHLGASWKHLGLILAHLGSILEHLGASWDHLENLLGHLGAILGASWAHLGASWSILGPLGPILGASWGLLGPSWEPSWAILNHLGSQLAPWYPLCTKTYKNQLFFNVFWKPCVNLCMHYGMFLGVFKSPETQIRQPVFFYRATWVVLKIDKQSHKTPADRYFIAVAFRHTPAPLRGATRLRGIRLRASYPTIITKF